jgi:hypothetical protein
MFYLLRMTFWLGIVCELLPRGGSEKPAARIDPASAVSAAGAAVSDMRGFCGRQPEACVVGGQVAVAIGHKAEAGARTIYELISAKLTEKTAGPANTVPAPERGTLTSADMTPVYRAPVPLPPRREARAGRGSGV